MSYCSLGIAQAHQMDNTQLSTAWISACNKFPQSSSCRCSSLDRGDLRYLHQCLYLAETLVRAKSNVKPSTSSSHHMFALSGRRRKGQLLASLILCLGLAALKRYEICEQAATFNLIANDLRRASVHGIDCVLKLDKMILISSSRFPWST